ncbi:putative zinc finger, CCHC-type containing protein [Tanacetum coccineum]
MEFYIENRDNGRMILDSNLNDPLVWPTVVQVDGTTKKKTYAELSATEKLQADCDLKATNIVLQSLPPDVYAIVNHHKVAKEIWDRVKLLMQGTKLSLQEKECKLHDEFDKFSFVKVQVNTKFLNSLPPEWSKFVINVKLARDLHITNYDQLNHATIQDDKVTTQQFQGRQGQSYAGTGYKGNATSSRGNNTGGHARVVKCYNCQGEGHMARQCTQPKQPRNAAWFKKKAMLAKALEAGQILDEEQLAFLADPGIPDDQVI